MEQANAGRVFVCWLWLVLVAQVAGLGLAHIGVDARSTDVTQALSAAPLTYGARPIARVDTQQDRALPTEPSLVNDVREHLALRSVVVRRTSMTAGSARSATNTAGLADDATGSYGPFHRLESPTQTPATAALQEANGEMWGATARGGLNPTVKAYQGPLPPGARRVEFTTPVRPSDVGLGRPGDIAIWRRGSPGVVDVDDDFVKIA